MMEERFRLDVVGCRAVLRKRLAEPAPGRIQLLVGPRQVGKTTLLLDLAGEHGPRALYFAADGPEAMLPGAWDRLWARADEVATRHGGAVLLLDEVHVLPRWSEQLKGEWDRIRRLRQPIHVVATGSSALGLDSGSRESLAGRFERLTLSHWSTAAVARAFAIAGEQAAIEVVRFGSYPGAFPLRDDVARWQAYVRDAIVEPAIGRDILALAPVRRPALLRQVFALAVSSPAQIVALQKLQGQLQDRGSLETIAHYLSLLEAAFLVAPLEKFSPKVQRRRAAPPKLIALNNALLAVTDGPSDPTEARWGFHVENACLAHAWNAGQRVTWWREEPYEVDAIVEGTWGRLAIEVKTGAFSGADLRGIAELTGRHRDLSPLVLVDPGREPAAERLGFPAMAWTEFLLRDHSTAKP